MMMSRPRRLDPFSGDELIWLLPPANEEWGVAVVWQKTGSALPGGGDRVVTRFEEGRIGFDGGRRDLLSWTRVADPTLSTPAERPLLAWSDRGGRCGPSQR